MCISLPCPYKTILKHLKMTLLALFGDSRNDLVSLFICYGYFLKVGRWTTQIRYGVKCPGDPLSKFYSSREKSPKRMSQWNISLSYDWDHWDHWDQLRRKFFGFETFTGAAIFYFFLKKLTIKISPFFGVKNWHFIHF